MGEQARPTFVLQAWHGLTEHGQRRGLSWSQMNGLVFPSAKLLPHEQSPSYHLQPQNDYDLLLQTCWSVTLLPRVKHRLGRTATL